MAFLAMFCWAFGDFFIQRSTRKVGDIQSLAFIGIIGGIILTPFIIKDFKLLFSLSNIILLSVLGVITFFAALFNFEALKKGKLSIVDVIIEIELPVTIILAYFFFKESLSLPQFSAIFLIFIGIILVATKSFSHWKVKIERGLILAVIAAIGMGFIDFLTSASSRAISPIMAIWFPWMIFSILCLAVIIKRGEFGLFTKNASKFKWLLIAMALFDTFAWLFYAYAVNKNDIAVITAITECYPALAMFLGLWINKERINFHQYLGAALAITASIALAFFI